MSCCGGGSSAGSAAQAATLVDEAVDAGTLVRLVYTCATTRTQAFTISGRVYQFGNNDRRRVNAVLARLAPNFLDASGRFYGCFEAFDGAKHNEDGTLIRPENLTELTKLGTA